MAELVLIHPSLALGCWKGGWWEEMGVESGEGRMLNREQGLAWATSEEMRSYSKFLGRDSEQREREKSKGVGG